MRANSTWRASLAPLLVAVALGRGHAISAWSCHGCQDAKSRYTLSVQAYNHQRDIKNQHFCRHCLSPSCCKTEAGRCDPEETAEAESWDTRNPAPGSLQICVETSASSTALLHHSLCLLCHYIRSSREGFSVGVRGCPRVCATRRGLSVQWECKLYRVKFLEWWCWESFLPQRLCKRATCEIKLNIASLGV